MGPIDLQGCATARLNKKTMRQKPCERNRIIVHSFPPSSLDDRSTELIVSGAGAVGMLRGAGDFHISKFQFSYF